MTWWEPTDGYLAHHGIKGQKWGIRRYQNPNGSLTALGEQRYRKYNANDADVMKKIWSDKSTSEWQKRDQWHNYQIGKREKLKNKIGADLVKDIKEGNGNWDQVITDVYFGDYSKFKTDSNAKKALDKGNEALNRIRKEERAQLDQTYDEMMSNKNNRSLIQKVKQSLVGETQKKRPLYSGSNKSVTDDDYLKIRKKVDNSEEAKKRDIDYDEARRMVDMAKFDLAREYKQATLDKILKRIPRDKRDDVFDLLFNEYWDYDSY